ncbi:uncharacterized protein LTR77_002370 [Saxophila tyrrhenica]|uniref:N-acetyltransferase domain-containing protein n=1 Tax=Saxophila tyrrhenica TaxID=1690608 RepID=A0AAV9PIZ9_9PEZI|nr:hypothetical protein LTR77_002370 [Saxophila tyrrhenica]
MKLNARTALSTPTTLLVPYTPLHVPTYHEWMQSPDLRLATASDPLTLSEEYAMQRSWRLDPDKLTFIICLPLPHPLRLPGDEGEETIKAGQYDDLERMVGDVNLFIYPLDLDEDESAAPPTSSVVGEIELMIASPLHRRKGYGRGALLAFISYVLAHWAEIAREYAGGTSTATATSSSDDAEPLRLDHLRVRINETNVGSIKLFEELGFTAVNEGKANYFGEVELRWYGGMEDLKGRRGWEEVRQLTYEGPGVE